MQQNETCIIYVLALRKMQQDKTDKQRTLPKQTNMKDNCYKVEWARVESLQKALQQNPFCAQICVAQQRLINEHVSKQIQQEPAQGRKVLVEKGSKMKAISSYVPALRTMQQDKTAANPNPPKTNQHEENCYKVHGYKSNHYRKQCSRIHSVSKRRDNSS